MTALIVQKYGGTSVATAERLKAVAQRVLETERQGAKVVVVVSAMGDATDELVDLALKITDRPDPRELDLLLSTGEVVSCTLLAMALRALGREAVALTGGQAGIRTDAIFSRAQIVAIDVKRIEGELSQNRIPIVAGFQGVTEDMDITTMGRGGSDTTAVALAVRLKAHLCEIYTDVDGVYTADPRLVPKARKLDEISYEEMLELAQQGAKVMHPRAVELGEVYDMPIAVRSSFNNNPGTIIHREAIMEQRNKVTGIAHDLDVAKISFIKVPDRPGIAQRIFGPLAEAGVSVDTIVQGAGAGSITDLSFTVANGDLPRALEIVKPAAKEIGAQDVISGSGLAKVSIVGTGMQHTPGYAARMFSALAQRNINIEMITTSEIRITCVIDKSRVKEAVEALHKAFDLEKKD